MVVGIIQKRVNLINSITEKQHTVVKNGIYRHYKDKLYEVLEEATHSESLETMVVYRALYGNFGLWVRPKEMFLETVLYNGKEVHRFYYLGENVLPGNENK
ncbi:MAG: DUF1653 domain-containing protein [Sporomusaceae bacterium]|nr:DUF1653 domain-containing protein [Sporomusaceae bacterium]